MVLGHYQTIKSFKQQFLKKKIIKFNLHRFFFGFLVKLVDLLENNAES